MQTGPQAPQDTCGLRLGGLAHTHFLVNDSWHNVEGTLASTQRASKASSSGSGSSKTLLEMYVLRACKFGPGGCILKFLGNPGPVKD